MMLLRVVVLNAKVTSAFHFWKLLKEMYFILFKHRFHHNLFLMQDGIEYFTLSV